MAATQVQIFGVRGLEFGVRVRIPTPDEPPRLPQLFGAGAEDQRRSAEPLRLEPLRDLFQRCSGSFSGHLMVVPTREGRLKATSARYQNIASRPNR